MEEQPINEISTASSILDAKLLGIAADGGTRLFEVGDIKGDFKGNAQPGTNPGIPVLQQYYNAKPGVTYPYFNNITIPLKFEGKSVIDAKLTWNGAAWESSFSLSEFDFASPEEVASSINIAIAALVNGSPADLDTLKKLAEAINFVRGIAETATTTEEVGLAINTGIAALVNGAPVELNTLKKLADGINFVRTIAETATTPDEVNTSINIAIAALIQGAPGALDTLNELAAAMGDDPNFAATVTNLIASNTTVIGSVNAKVDQNQNQQGAINEQVDLKANLINLKIDTFQTEQGAINEQIYTRAETINVKVDQYHIEQGAINEQVDLKANLINLKIDTFQTEQGAINEQFDLRTNQHGQRLTAVEGVANAATTPAQMATAINLAIANLIAGAPGALDTLKELATAMGDDPNFAATITNLLANLQQAIDETTAMTPVLFRSNSVIDANGNIAALAGYNISVIYGIPGDIWRVKNAVASTGSTVKRAYSFFNNLTVVNSTTLISGKTAVSTAQTIDEVLTFPAGAVMILFSENGNAKAYKRNYSLLKQITAEKAELITTISDNKKIATDASDANYKRELTLSSNNSVIGSTGEAVAIAGLTIKTMLVNEGEVYRVVNTLSSTGTTIKRAYGLYNDIVISEETFASGATAIGTATVTDEIVTIPAGVKMIGMSDNGKAAIYQRGVLILQSISKNQETVLGLLGLTERLQPFYGYNKYAISPTGDIILIGASTTGIAIKFFNVVPGRKYEITTIIPSTGVAKLPYAFYKSKSATSVDFISGGESRTASRTINKLVVEAPSESVMIVVSDNNGSCVLISEVYTNYENTIDPRFRRSFSNELNLAVAPFERVRNTRANYVTGLNEYISGSDSGIDIVTWIDTIANMETPVYSYTTNRVDLGTEYILKRVDSGSFVPLNYIFGFRRSKSLTAYTMCFWINTTDLDGNDLILNISAADVFLNADLKKIGSGIRVGSIVAMVDAISGDYSHIIIKFSSETTVTSFGISVNNSAGKSVSQLRIIKPYIFEGDVNIDPFSQYHSKSDLNRSKLKGVRAMFFGDSQLKNVETFIAMEELGVSVHHIQDGGRAIKYRTGQAEADKNWIYHWDRMKTIPKVNAQIFISRLSTNDGGGGGVLSEETVNAVLNNYPNINDIGNDTEIARKLALFNAMTEADKVAMFAYKPVMGALIKQLLIANQNARIILCTIPFSRGTATDSAAIRVARAGSIAIRNDIFELGLYYNCPVIDLHTMVNLAPENALTLESDGTHWGSMISMRNGHIIASELNKYIL